MERALYRFIVVGNKDRYFFLQKLLSLNNFNNLDLLFKSDIEIVYDKIPTVKNLGYQWEITTPLLIPSVSLYFPSDISIIQLANYSLTNYIFLLEGDPFRRQDNVILLRKIRKDFPQAHIIIGLMDMPRQQAYTDTLPVGEDLRIAQQKYMEDGYDAVVLKEMQDIQIISDWYDPIYNVWQRSIYNNLVNLSERINVLDIDFKIIWEQLLSDGKRLPETQAQKICSYDTLKRNQNESSFDSSLWKIYVDGGLKILFPDNKKGGVFDFLSLYQQTLDETNLAIWNINEDEKELINKLKGAYFAMFEKSKYAKIAVPVFNEESDYEKMLSDKKNNLFGIRVEFSKLYKNFIENEILSVIQKMLVERYNRLRGLLNES